MTLTKNEQMLIRGLRSFIKHKGRIPSYRELAAHLGWSKSLVAKYVERLVAKGILSREDGVSKSLQIK